MTGSSNSQSSTSWTRISRGKQCFSTFNDDLLTSDAYDQEVGHIISRQVFKQTMQEDDDAEILNFKNPS